jgi:hypothetical protein
MFRLLQSRSLLILVGGVGLGVLLSYALLWSDLAPGDACISPLPLLWPLAAVLIAALLSHALVLVARLGIRVEIFTRTPIDISTECKAIQAEVTRVRL